jgi:hypothetical protein
MRDLSLTITRNADGLGATLRADLIRRDTLVQLARALRSDNWNHVQNVLDNLIDVVDGPRDSEGAEVDALVAEIEAEAGMESASVDLSATALQQLARESADAVNGLIPLLRPVGVLPSQRNQGAA